MLKRLTVRLERMKQIDAADHNQFGDPPEPAPPEAEVAVKEEDVFGMEVKGDTGVVCRKCQSQNVKTIWRQSASADEGGNIDCTCRQCHAYWVISHK